MDKKILILSYFDDVHAQLVQQTLWDAGCVCSIWSLHEFPNKQRHSFHFHNNEVKWQKFGLAQTVENQYDTVWLRRPKSPSYPKYCHPSDRNNAHRENVTFYQSLWPVAFQEGVWVNDYLSACSANSKLYQLQVVQKVICQSHKVKQKIGPVSNAKHNLGQESLKVPSTLFSNDPKQIRAFLNCHEKQGIVFKTLFPQSWQDNNGLRLCYTTPIQKEDLPSDWVLQSVVGIYQIKVPKQYEVRATYMGGKIVAVKIHSQIHQNGGNDWRYIPTGELTIEAIELPPTIKAQCQRMMKELGLLFGCIDLIVTPDGEYYFLEVNEQGQFLWIDDIAPSINMLEQFCAFLIAPHKHLER